MLEWRDLLDGYARVGERVQRGHDHAIGTFANVLEIDVARSDLERLAPYDLDIRILCVFN